MNRHKIKEVFKSGSSKRKIAKEKEKKNEEFLAKSCCMANYVIKSTITFSVALKINVDNTRSFACGSQSQNINYSEMINIHSECVTQFS